MLKKKINLNEIFGTVPVSEPLSTFRDNLEALIGILGESTGRFEAEVDHLSSSLKDAAKLRDDLVGLTSEYVKLARGERQLLERMRKLVVYLLNPFSPWDIQDSN